MVFEADVNNGFGHTADRSWESETQSDAEVANIVERTVEASDSDVVVVEISTKAIADALEIVAARVGHKLESERSFPTVVEFRQSDYLIAVDFELRDFAIFPRLVSEVGFDHKAVVPNVVDASAMSGWA